MSSHFRKVPVTKEEIAKHPVYKTKKGVNKQPAKEERGNSKTTTGSNTDAPYKSDTSVNTNISNHIDNTPLNDSHEYEDEDADMFDEYEDDNDDEDSSHIKPPGISTAEFDEESDEHRFQNLILDGDLDDWYVPENDHTWLNYP